MLGLETALALAITELDVDLAQILALLSWRPAVIAGLGSYYLTRSLAQTGVLASFPAGRAQSRV